MSLWGEKARCWEPVAKEVPRNDVSGGGSTVNSCAIESRSQENNIRTKDVDGFRWEELRRAG